MPGLAYDIVIIFIAKTIGRLVGRIKSKQWMQIAVALSNAAVLDPFWGCPSVALYYRVVVDDGRTVERSTTLPFLLRRSAQRFVSGLLPNSKIIIRVNPLFPDRSLFFDVDQTDLKVYRR